MKYTTTDKVSWLLALAVIGWYVWFLGYCLKYAAQ